MNARRRKQIEKIIGALCDMRGDIECIQSDEQEAYENLPESIQNGYKGESMSNAIDNLSYAIDELDTLVEYLENAKE